MKVYVINLDRRPDRLQEISDKLKAIGLDFETISAVDGKKLNHKKYINRFLAPLYSGPDSEMSGAIGCYLSHRTIWQKIVKSKVGQALILEDDADPVAWDAKIMNVRLLDMKLDLLRVGANKLKNIVTQKEIRYTNNYVIGRRLINEPTYGTCAYIITLEGARKCLLAKKYWFPIDHFHLWKSLYGLNSALLTPPLFMPSDSSSDIVSNDHKPLLLGTRNKISASFKRKFRRLVWKAVDCYANCHRM